MPASVCRAPTMAMPSMPTGMITSRHVQQGVVGEQVHRRRAVDDDGVVAPGRSLHAAARQNRLALRRAGQLRFEREGRRRRRNDVEPLAHAADDHLVGGASPSIRSRIVVSRWTPSAWPTLPCGSASTSSTRAPRRGQPGREVDRGRRLADAAFHVDDRDVSHGRPFRPRSTAGGAPGRAPLRARGRGGSRGRCRPTRNA